MSSFAARCFCLSALAALVVAVPGVASLGTAFLAPPAARAQSAGQQQEGAAGGGQRAQARSIDDFEAYSAGQVPADWKYINRDEDVFPLEEKLEEREQFEIVREDGNQFVRICTKNQALRATQRNGQELDWSLEERPYLQWEWRAHQLPEGASEKGENDTGAAVYVTFGSDWLGRPKSIKYTYSSTLPVGTAVDFGPLKALVVASGAEPMGNWLTETRDVARDYRNLFGEAPPRDAPISITLWSDSDSTGGTAEVDFDDLRLLSEL